MGFGLGPMEMVIVGMIALLLFGKRLPEVARSLGKGIVEFKKGVRGIEEEVNTSTYNQSSASQSSYRPQASSNVQEVSAPKFEPPTSEPVSTSGEPVDERSETT